MTDDKDPKLPSGRYGTDELYRFLLWTCILLALLRLPFGRTVFGYLLLGAVVLCAGFAFFRSLSRNIPARRAENRAFLRLCRKIGRFLRLQRDRIRDRDKWVYRVCPECNAIIRMRRRSGEYELTCPRCGEHFDVHIR